MAAVRPDAALYWLMSQLNDCADSVEFTCSPAGVSMTTAAVARIPTEPTATQSVTGFMGASLRTISVGCFRGVQPHRLYERAVAGRVPHVQANPGSARGIKRNRVVLRAECAEVLRRNDLS